MNNEQDKARVIAKRVARRLAGDVPQRQDVPERARSNGEKAPDQPRARMIDFISSEPPLRSAPSIVQPSSVVRSSEAVPFEARADYFQFVPVTQSPWLGRMPAMLGASPSSQIPNTQIASHPSQERFGVEEAAVAELVEFFENEKKCTVEPGGKPCDHCAMCSSRGF